MDDLHRQYGELPVERYDVLPLPTDSLAKETTAGTPCISGDGSGQLDETESYSIDQAIADAIEQMDHDPLPDPFTGDHNIEYWIWTGRRLVPASPEESERLRRQEALEEEEFRLLRKRQCLTRVRRRQAFRRIIERLMAPLRHITATRRTEIETRRAKKE
jgi:hypothetical protein